MTDIKRVYCCPECGDLDIQCTAWVEMNNWEVVNDEGPMDGVYCPSCEETTGDGHHKRCCWFDAADPERLCSSHGSSHTCNVDEDKLQALLGPPHPPKGSSFFNLCFADVVGIFGCEGDSLEIEVHFKTGTTWGVEYTEEEREAWTTDLTLLAELFRQSRTEAAAAALMISAHPPKKRGVGNGRD